jgi:threonine/homoserine/homoserine lactone efflux protein
MTVTASDLGLYAVALLILFLTPGPVWMALMARSLAGGFRQAWPLALGVAVGDVAWPLLAILGLSWITSEHAAVLSVLRWVACAFFIWLGWSVIRHADSTISTDRRMTRPGRLAGFLAGVAAILGNPKAILFYLGVLPGFFDLSAVTGPDILAICALSILVPLVGNLFFAALIGRIAGTVRTPRSLRRLNLSAGWLLIGVGVILPFT